MRSPYLITGALTAACIAAVTAVAIAQPLGMPARRAGMWRTTISGVGEQAGGMTMSMCVDPAQERSFSPMSVGPYGRGPHAASDCSKQEAHRIADGWSFESVCTRQGRTVTSSGKVTGDFQSHIHFELVTNGEGPPRRIVTDTTWVGPCVAGGGQTITLPDGRVITIPSH